MGSQQWYLVFLHRDEKEYDAHKFAVSYEIQVRLVILMLLFIL